MTLQDLVKVLPGYTTMHVHDKEGNFAYKGHPHEFILGLYKSHVNDLVCLINPIDSYRIEVITKETEHTEEENYENYI